ncbi:MAG: MarC family protein, partial [Alphaproteobacteria bacterium]
MFETALVAFMTFFATVGPVDVAAIFAALTPKATTKERRAMAVKGVAIATLLLLIFIVFGNAILVPLGITLPVLRTAGGILLLLVAIDMVFARHSGIASTTLDETKEAAAKTDISVFPLATPLLAGPGALGAAILLSATAEGDFLGKMIIIATM